MESREEYLELWVDWHMNKQLFPSLPTPLSRQRLRLQWNPNPNTPRASYGIMSLGEFITLEILLSLGPLFFGMRVQHWNHLRYRSMKTSRRSCGSHPSPAPFSHSNEKREQTKTFCRRHRSEVLAGFTKCRRDARKIAQQSDKVLMKLWSIKRMFFASLSGKRREKGTEKKFWFKLIYLWNSLFFPPSSPPDSPSPINNNKEISVRRIMARWI